MATRTALFVRPCHHAGSHDVVAMICYLVMQFLCDFEALRLHRILAVLGILHEAFSFLNYLAIETSKTMYII